MGKKVRVLQINASSEYGGVSSMLFNIYKNIDREKFYFDFLSPNKTSFELKRDEIEELGGKLFGLGVSDNNKAIRYIKLYCRLKKFLKNKSYNIVHINSGSRIYNAIVSECCKRNTKAKIIIHSHNGKDENSFKARIAKKIIEKNADIKFSCSDIASKAMFAKMDEIIIIKNGIDASKFKYDEKNRKIIRKEFGINENERLIGNIGRLVSQKNQLFLLDVFNEAKKQESQIKLLIVGSGELEGIIKEKIQEYGLQDSVIVVNNRNDMPSIYSALDVFVLPSLYEGLPVSAIEAQYNGLPTILSSAIDAGARISTSVTFCDLSDKKEWIRLMLESNRSDWRLIESYDITDTVKLLEEVYLV